VRLTYLDCNNAFLQLVEPLSSSGPVAHSLAAHGEGLHHVCFSVQDVARAAAALADPGSPDVVLGRGRGRRSAFVPGPTHFGVRLECTELDRSIPRS
jgi:catechol 2,3-dioxygenase-like lactoylglutathione lyase family enzyme